MDNSYVIIVLFITYVFVYYMYINIVNKKMYPNIYITDNETINKNNGMGGLYSNNTIICMGKKINIENILRDILYKINKNLVLMSINRIDKVEDTKYNIIFFATEPLPNKENDITYKFNTIIVLDMTTYPKYGVAVEFVGKSVHKDIDGNTPAVANEGVSIANPLFNCEDTSGLDPRFIYGLGIS